MRHLAIINDGVVSNVVIGDPESFPTAIDVTDLSPRPGPRWTYNGEEFAPPVVVAEQSRRITRLAFRNRFTQAELVALEIASLDNPAADMAVRQQAASLRVMNANLATATFIDRARADTRGGVQQLEAGGLLAAGRALEILDAPIGETEAWTG